MFIFIVMVNYKITLLRKLEFLKKNSLAGSSESLKKPSPSASASNSKSSSSSSLNSSNNKVEDPPSRSYTPEQVEGIKRIKACKAKGDLYAVLGLEKGCSDSDIKKAYRKVSIS